MSLKRIIPAVSTAVILLAIACAGHVSADESVPLSSTTTTVAQQHDEESRLTWSQVDEYTIEVSFPD